MPFRIYSVLLSDPQCCSVLLSAVRNCQMLFGAVKFRFVPLDVLLQFGQLLRYLSVLLVPWRCPFGVCVLLTMIVCLALRILFACALVVYVCLLGDSDR